jgi:AcrR family transcriptional regulator
VRNAECGWQTVDTLRQTTYRSVVLNRQSLDRRQQILGAALKRFAEPRYAATSVQEIVDDAQVTKPTLYYYFRNKAELYEALVDWALDERFRLLQEAVAAGGSLKTQLIEICASLFDFLRSHRELMRLACGTAFAAPGEVPAQIRGCRKGWRNFDFIHELMKNAKRAGALSARFGARELAMGFVGCMHFYVMACLVDSKQPLNRRTAQRIVEFFLAGAQTT